MRIATWNVNSLNARLEKVLWWLERARPDVLLMQETKLADDAVPLLAFRGAGYEVAHHGEGRWNGVAIASRVGISEVVTNFGRPLRTASTGPAAADPTRAAAAGDVAAGSSKAPFTAPSKESAESAAGMPAGTSESKSADVLEAFLTDVSDADDSDADASDADASDADASEPRADGDPGPGAEREAHDDEPLAEARMISALCGGVRVVCLYAPNGRVVDSPFYWAKLEWYERLARWLGASADPGEPIILGGDFNVAPSDADVWDPRACHGGTHVSPPERKALQALCEWGLVDAYRLKHDEPGRFTWWDYRGGSFHMNKGMRIDLLLVTNPVAGRTVWAEIDREARKGKPMPSDHAPLVIDVDEPGHPFDAGWAGAESRIASRRPSPRPR